MILFLVAYLLIINIVSFAVCGRDKKLAVMGKSKRRISEKALFLLCVAGGSLGMWLGMYHFRHKTRHWYFVYGVPLIFFLQIIAAIAINKICA